MSDARALPPVSHGDAPPPIGEGDPRKGSEVRAMFDAIAPRYDVLNAVLSLGVDRGWRRQAVAAALAHGPADVLDVATGTADLAIALRRARPEARVVGVDFAEAMLAVGRVKAARQGVDVRLEVGDGTALPYADASFDAVTIAYGLRNFADVDAGLREIRRVLRPGGRLVVLEFPPPPRGAFGRLFRFYFTRVVPVLGGWVSGRRSAYAYLPASVLAFPEPEALAERMRAAGFQNVSFRLQTLGVSALHRGDVA
ncbi:MAG: bifunctional demethylmenaquinone methyltransferase/2-methoxy-6-polyprenyl-1,4-benzoquinol methylase UbiE [Trueperaceae bacterium]|nr:bifunctional demethylmenaquinone methyltransferase/2-methoxy-6-polyprenyl-1,4-benzoquinol methylase UbiE [Trueperaceae bacterium]